MKGPVRPLRWLAEPRAALLPLILALGFGLGGCASTGPEEPPRADGRDPQIRVPQQTPPGESVKTEFGDIEPTVVAFRDYDDPLIRVNRAIFAFNDVSYRYVLIPIAEGYLNITPEPVQTSVGNFFYNIKEPLYLINHGLQLEPKLAGINFLRFCINTTLGILGLFDPASAWFELERVDTDFEDTLAHYGADYGIYLVLPLLGPSDLRSGTSKLVEGLLHPIRYLAENPERTVIQAVDNLQEFAPSAERYTTLHNQSEDPYIFFRNLYLQGVQRDAAYQ